MREVAAGALMSSSMLWRITQSPPTFVPASAAARAALREAKLTARIALNAKANSMMPRKRVKKSGKISANSTSDWPRVRPARRRRLKIP